MSQAELLLNSVETLSGIHEHPVIDFDQHYVIDPVSRVISNVSGKNVLIQYDHNSERFTFEISRYVDGHDMSLCNATKIHYINIEVVEQDPTAMTVVKPKTNAGVYEVDDIQVSPDDDDIVTCSWLISRNATQLPGTVSFLIQYACVDDEGNLTYEWHTDIYADVLVNTGMNNGVQILANSADIIEQWKNQLFAEVEEWKVEVLAGIEKDVREIASSFQDGKDGEDGYTPVKGLDYFTDAEQTQFKNEVFNALSPKSMTVTLVSSNWSSNKQTITATGVTSDTTKTIVMVSPDPITDNYNTYNENAIRCISQGDNTLTFQCESVPTMNIAVNIVVHRTSIN